MNTLKSEFVELFGENPVESGKWEVGKIEDIVDRNIKTAKKSFLKSDIIKYVDISAIDNTTNLVTGFTEYELSKAPSRAQQVIQKYDILISTVRPNLRNIAINYFNNSNIVGSSGFCVLRPIERCVPEYLFYCVLSDNFTKEMVSLTNGANYPAIRDADVLNYQISIPPLNMQNQFAAFVQQIDKSKFVVQEALLKIHSLCPIIY